MADFILQYYMVVKALHIISIISWMAGMLYLPRIFVYHAQAEKGSDSAETFKVMERKLLRYIMNPAMIAAWLFGGLMLFANPSLFQNGWIHVKLTGVILLTVLHHVYAAWRKTFAADKNEREARFYKIWNEAPTLLMVVIVIMAVVKPF